MVSVVSGTSAQTTTVLSSSSDSGSKTAELKAELAAKQDELAQAKTDDEKSQIQADISKLQAQIAASQLTDRQGADKASQSAPSARPQRHADERQFNTADKAAPESKLSSASMDVLMRLGPQRGGAGQPDVSKIYTDMDADGDGKVTKDEFVSANADRMGEDRASKLFSSIDTENTGSITEDQFAQSLSDHDRHAGGPRTGHPPGGFPAPDGEAEAPADETSATTIDA